jgi:hypothetical protein
MFFLLSLNSLYACLLAKYRLFKIYVECTANEGPVRIQFQCLVPIYVFPEMKLSGPQNRIIMFCLPICFCERFLYYQAQSAYLAECRNWERGRAVSFLGTHKSDFRYSVSCCTFSLTYFLFFNFIFRGRICI